MKRTTVTNNCFTPLAACCAAVFAIAALPAAEPSVCASPAVQLKLHAAHSAPAVSAGAMEGRSTTRLASDGRALNATTIKGTLFFFR